MTLKCPVCGKEYFYEGKICQDCEDYSTYSGLTKIESFDKHKWNCALFLEKDNSAFKVSSYCIPYSKLTPEPVNIKIGERVDYEWNSDTFRRFSRRSERTPAKSWLDLLSKLADSELDFIEKRDSTPLIYE